MDMDADELEDDFEPIGSLIDIPLGRLILQIHRLGQSGLLHIEPAERKTWIFFDAGRPAAAHDPSAEVYLGMVLRELGLIDDATFQRSLLEMAETGKLQGQVLLEMGCIDRAQLDQALQLQQLRKVAALFSLRSATYRFVEGAGLPARVMAHPVHPFAVVYHGICNCFGEEDLTEHLAPLASTAIVAGPCLAEFEAQVKLGEDEQAALELLAQPHTLETFVAQARCGPMPARMLSLALFWCQALRLDRPSEVPVTPAPAKPSQPQLPQRPAQPPAKPPAQKIVPRMPPPARPVDPGPLPLTINPDAAAVAYLKAKVYLQKKLLDKACAAFDLAARLDPAMPSYLARRIHTEYLLEADPGTDRLRQVTAELERLCKLHPSDFWTHRLLATAYKQLDDTRRYELHLIEAYALRPDDLDTAHEHKQIQLQRP